jgi:hypothetical protein
MFSAIFTLSISKRQRNPLREIACLCCRVRRLCRCGRSSGHSQGGRCLGLAVRDVDVWRQSDMSRCGISGKPSPVHEDPAKPQAFHNLANCKGA